MRKQIFKIIKTRIGWYEIVNYHIYTGCEFVKIYGNEFTESEKTLFKNVSRIQRQCDCYAIELVETKILT